MKHTNYLPVTCLICFLMTPILYSDSANSDSKSKHETDEEQKVTLEGVIESIETSEVKLEPEEWTTYEVDTAVEHGQEVQRGDTLLSFKTGDYEKAVEDAEIELRLAELALESATLELESTKKSLSLDMKAAEDADREATDALKEYLTHGKENRLKSIEQSLTSSRNNLMYQEEELKQLKKMYQADDLTEETEEIILIRTKNTVEQARYSFELAQDRRRQALEFEMPKQEDALQTTVKQAALALEKARETLPRKLAQQEVNLKKQQIAVQEQAKKLKRLVEDKATLRVVATQSGTVYYGSINRGKVGDSATVDLRAGATAKASTVLMTVVDNNKLVVHVNVPEDKLRHVTVDTECEIESVAYPDQKLSGRIKSVSRIPISDGMFDGVVEFDMGELKGRLLPGMKAKCRIKN